MWEYITIAILSIIIIVLLLLMLLPKSTEVLNGDPFPHNKIVVITNQTIKTLQNIIISDSQGNSYPYTSTWLPGKSISLAIPVFNNYDHLDIYGAEMNDTTIVSEVCFHMVNIDHTVVYHYLYGTPATTVTCSASTSSVNAIQPLFLYDNTTYTETGQKLSNGDMFPQQFVLYNNTGATVLTNSDNQSGSNPNADKLVITTLYITDSAGNTYLDVQNNRTFDQKKNTTTADLLKSQLIIRFDHPIQPTEYVQMYLEDSEQNSYDIVIHNHNDKAVISYSSNMDSTAILIVKLPEQRREPCRSLFAKPVVEPGASFLSSSLWPNGSTIKVGFYSGEPWQKAWIAKVVHDRIVPYVNLTFNFVFDNMPTLTVDTSYQIRISFDPTSGAWSNMGIQSSWINYKPGTTEPINPQPASMNFGWMDAPASYTFTYDGTTYTTPTTFNNGGYGGVDVNGNGYGTTIVHEFCHALGMQHEHTTPFGNPFNYDKKAVYEQYSAPPNNWSREQIDIQVLQFDSALLSNGSNFDYMSVMKYTTDTNLLQQPVSFQVATWANTANYKLSNCDIVYLSRMYPGKPISVTCSLADHPLPTAAPIVISN